MVSLYRSYRVLGGYSPIRAAWTVLRFRVRWWHFRIWHQWILREPPPVALSLEEVRDKVPLLFENPDALTDLLR